MKDGVWEEATVLKRRDWQNQGIDKRYADKGDNM
jgi:hypothetical protein